MPTESLTEAVESYVDQDLSLSESAATGGVTEEELTEELRSRGVELADDEAGAVTSTRY